MSRFLRDLSPENGVKKTKKTLCLREVRVQELEPGEGDNAVEDTDSEAQGKICMESFLPDGLVRL